MSPEDEKRLLREYELWLATQGPDYSQQDRLVGIRNEEIAKGKAAHNDRLEKIYLLQHHHPSELGDVDHEQER